MERNVSEAIGVESEASWSQGHERTSQQQQVLPKEGVFEESGLMSGIPDSAPISTVQPEIPLQMEDKLYMTASNINQYATVQRGKKRKLCEDNEAEEVDVEDDWMTEEWLDRLEYINDPWAYLPKVGHIMDEPLWGADFIAQKIAETELLQREVRVEMDGPVSDEDISDDNGGSVVPATDETTPKDVKNVKLQA